MIDAARWGTRKPSVRKFIRMFGGRLLSVSGAVVILGDESSRDTIDEWVRVATGRVHVVSERKLGTFAGSRLHVADEMRSIADITLQINPIAVLVDAREDSDAGHLARFEELFFRVAENGHYVAPEGEATTIWSAVDALKSADRVGTREREAIDESLGERLVFARIVAFPSTRTHLLKVREDHANVLLPLRNPELRLQVLDSLPGGTIDWKSRVFQHGFTMHVPNAHMTFHAAHIRHYRGPVRVGSHMLTTASGTILPSSFRHPHLPRVNSTEAPPLNDHYALLKPAETESVELEGSYYDLNASIDGHFGHVLTETLAKLWGWNEAKRVLPNLKAYYRLPHGDYDPSVERTLFTAYGIDEDDIHWATQNESVSSFVSSSLLWQNGGQRHFHPHIAETWAKLRQALVTPDPASPARIFISRKYVDENRSCRNVGEVENVFREAGFAIVYPEALSMAAQAQLFGNARSIAGFAGSGMFNMLFAAHLDTLIVLSHNSYTARNELMYGAMIAEESHYLWSAADLQHPPGTFSEAAFHSPWEFDFQANGEVLARLLAA